MSENTAGMPRTVANAVRRGLRQAGEAGADRGPVFAVAAVVALRLAERLDAAAKAGDARLVIAVSRELRTVLAGMGLDPGGAGDGQDGQPPAAEPGADGLDAELAGLLGAGPEVGDAAHA